VRSTVASQTVLRSKNSLRTVVHNMYHWQGVFKRAGVCASADTTIDGCDAAWDVATQRRRGAQALPEVDVITSAQ
jgi:hypothetical protein